MRKPKFKIRQHIKYLEIVSSFFTINTKKNADIKTINHNGYLKKDIKNPRVILNILVNKILKLDNSEKIDSKLL